MTTNTQDLSLDEMDALIKQLSERKKAVKAAAHAVLGGMLEEFVEHRTTERDLTYSDTSAWVGIAENGIPVTVDGVEYSVTVNITHVAEKARRLPTYTAACEVANEQKLAGDERKAFLKEAMAETVNA